MDTGIKAEVSSGKPGRFVPETNIDVNSPLPLHYQVSSQIKQSLLRQRVKPGTPLLSMLNLSQALKLNRETVRQAYETLLEEGVLERIPPGRILSVSATFAAQYLNNYLPALGLVLPLQMESLVRNKALAALELVAGVMDAAFKLGFSATVIPMPEDGTEVAGLRRWLDEMFPKLNGLVYLGETTQDQHGEAFELLLAETSLPQVFIGGEAFRPHLGTVTVDYAGISAAVQHLRGLGHRNFGVITYRIPTRKYFQLQTLARARRMRMSIEEAGQTRDEWIIPFEDIATSIPALLKSPDHPTAFLCHNDATALELVKLMDELGVRIPEDVSIVGYDDSFRAAEANPPLTTIRQPNLQMGEAAVSIIAESVRKRIPANELSRCLSTALIVRQSTGPIKKEGSHHEIFQ